MRRPAKPPLPISRRLPWIDLNPPAVVGEREAGRAATVRKRLMMLVGDIAEHTFDLADLLVEAADGNMYPHLGL